MQDKFRGALLGAMVGDIAGAVVEAEVPQYIAASFASLEEILALDTVPEFLGPDWVVGRFTDDTQMSICVAEWLIAGEAPSGERLLARFADAFEAWRRYGPGTETILRLFPDHRSEWRALATAQFPHGSYGNGSAMRAAPVGLAYHNDLKRAAAVAIESSRPTHAHPLAFQGAAIQAVAVAIAVEMQPADFDAGRILTASRSVLAHFDELMQDTSPYGKALDAMEAGLARGASCAEMSSVLGTGVEAFEAVPMALYCALRHPDSYAECIRQAIFIGGDTDTIACMAGAVSGALLGKGAIPAAWLAKVREERYTPAAVEDLADRMFEMFAG